MEGTYHVESLNRSVQLHVSGFLPSDCYEQTIKGSKGSCIGCRWHKTSFWAKYILTVESYEFSKIFLLSRRRKSLNRSKIACTQAAGEMHVCASLIWSADVGTNRAVHTDQFDLFSDFFGRFSDSTWYIRNQSRNIAGPANNWTHEHCVLFAIFGYRSRTIIIEYYQ